jgi:hypothetical protein
MAYVMAISVQPQDQQVLEKKHQQDQWQHVNFETQNNN